LPPLIAYAFLGGLMTDKQAAEMIDLLKLIHAELEQIRGRIEQYVERPESESES